MNQAVDSTSVPPSGRADIRETVIRVTGTVQGVGFRPYVWKVATEFGLKGSVRNDSEGVLIQAWGTPANIQALISHLHANTLPLADVTGVEVISDNAADSLPDSFSIISSATGQPLTSVSADAATCPDCLQDTLDPENRRFGYPFTNCTHCGPRFSIIRAIPYDRANTSMQAFTMCPACQREYDDPADRRFHAQPNACPDCGPTLWFTLSGDTSARCPRPEKSSVKAKEKNPAQAEDKNISAIK
ncbi:MAG: acylphosphatase, partial [Thalassolituus sp.]